LLLRKSASIILLLVLLFNMIGYRAWFYYAERKSDMAMEARLDKDQYNENDLVSLTVPLDNPYQLEQKSFQRIDGEISFQGKTFKFVKRMVSDGKLILLCIPDARKMVLKKAKTEYGNAANDMTGNSKGSSRSGSQKNYNGNDYISQTFQLNTSILPYFHTSILNSVVNTKLVTVHVAAPGKPPQTTMA
jgi:cbb3-type cytochrome oxidase subunit 3